jgi:hypothetical protein
VNCHPEHSRRARLPRRPPFSPPAPRVSREPNRLSPLHLLPSRLPRASMGRPRLSLLNLCALCGLPSVTSVLNERGHADPFLFQSLPHSFAQRRSPNPFPINHLRTLSIITEGVPPHPERSILHTYFHFRYTFPSSVSCNSFICQSYENCRDVGVFFPIWNRALPSCEPACAGTPPVTDSPPDNLSVAHPWGLRQDGIAPGAGLPCRLQVQNPMQHPSPKAHPRATRRSRARTRCEKREGIPS